VWRVNAFDRDGREVARFELASGELTIGREADRHLVLQSASVSRRHARIVVDGGQPCIVDEGSSNGVIVDGIRIAGPTPVGPQSRIDIAEFRVSVEPVGQPAGMGIGMGMGSPPGMMGAPQMGAPLGPPPMVPGPPAMGMPMGTGSQPMPMGGPMPMGTGAQPMPPVGGAEALRLVAEGGPFDGRVFNLRQGMLAVGRAVDNDLVFEDPSLSRKHARIHVMGDTFEVEDLGSSNGSFVNNRRIQRAPAAPGDVVRFGDLSFRVEGGAPGSTRSVDGTALPLPKTQLYALVGGGAFTFVMVLLAIIFLIRKVPPVAASGNVAIAKIARSAEQHLERGRTLYKERKFTEAKLELDQAYEQDPANPDIRKLRTLAARAPEDERAYRSAIGMLALADRKELERALRMYEEITDGAPQRGLLATKLTASLDRLGREACGRKQWNDCAWAICREYEIAPADSPPDARAGRLLRDAEKKLTKDRSYQRCRSAR
jgi:pSer/pThr/pTyr-binding forkhead associated (FHA) protein